MLFSRVKISCFCAKDHLVFDGCLHNKKSLLKLDVVLGLLIIFVSYVSIVIEVPYGNQSRHHAANA